MRGGFRPLVNPPSRIGDVDLEETRADRERLHDEIRTRDHLRWLLSVTTPGVDLVRITPYEVHELDEREGDEPASIAELYELATSGTGVSA